MQQFYLTEIKTTDHLLHQGIFYRGKKRGLCAFLWVHGLMGKFYGNLKLYEAFARACDKYGYGFAAFNNRGHDIVTGIKKVRKNRTKYLTVGASNERFKDCIYDIDVGIKFLCAQGYKKIILVGHSTGANKVCYYAAKKKDSRVLGVVLAGPASDRLVTMFKGQKIQQKFSMMRRLVTQGKGDQLTVGYCTCPITPRRFLSLYTPHSTEDTFDYGDAKPQLTYFSKIKKPLLAIFGADDECAGRSLVKIQQVFASHAHAKSYRFKVISEANHSFGGKEKEFVSMIINWVKII